MPIITRRNALALLAATCLSPAATGLANQDTGQQLVSKGHELLLSGKPAEALAALREAAKEDPANPWIFNLLGRAYYQTGQAFQAAANFRAALRIDPGDGYSLMMLDILAQRPIPAAQAVPQGDAKPSRRKRTSQLEEEAGRELEAFAKSGQPPGRRLILIDPGHGGTDIGVAVSSGLAEKDLTLALAGKLAQALGGQATQVVAGNTTQAAVDQASSGPRVLLTRESDFDEPLWARSAMAGLFGADFFVSLHCSASLPGYGGVEIYTFSPEPSDDEARAVAALENGVTRFERSLAPKTSRPGAMDMLASWQTRRLASQSREAARRLASALSLDKPLDKVRLASAPLKVLANARCPALLIQVGFLSNPQEEEALKNGKFLEKLATTLAAALTRSLG